jgi:uncharacterized lipoprotein YddW (UPF0748 family)
VRRVLEGAGVRCVPVTQDQVLAGALDARPVAVIPYAPNLSDEARVTLKTFCGDGGRVICFYHTLGLEHELGLRSTTHVASPKNDLFRYVRFRPGVLPGLPDGFTQNSWNIGSPSPLPGTQVLADWLGADGKPSGYAAATLSDGGLFFTHILLDNGADAERTEGLMLRAAVEHLAVHTGQRRPIAIVRGTLTETPGNSNARLVPQVVEEMEQMLDAAGLPYVVLTDQSVGRGALRGRRVAILPLNSTVNDAEVAQLQQFVGAGGRVMGCFSLDARIGRLMGVESMEFRSGGSPTSFNVVRFEPSAPAAFPRSFVQNAWNSMQARPAADGKVLATWQRTDGTDVGCPAVIASPTGIYFSYLLRTGDLPQTSRFLMACIGQMTGPQVYALAAQHTANALWDFRRTNDRAGFLAACGGQPAAEQAVSLEKQAQAKLAAGDALGALDAFTAARAAAESAFIASLPSRGGVEFRGVWLGNPFVAGDDWDAFFEGMRKAHLNAFSPNVSSGGWAHYKSAVLPLSRQAQQRGDQVAQMIAAAHRHGVQVHLWRACFNLMGPDQDVLKKLVAENRVCLDPQGQIVGGPNNGSLCPSNPQNQQLEIDAMVEMAVNLHPDGVQFDYIRYPGSEACFCSGCRQRFEKTIGHPVANWPKDVLSGGPLFAGWNDFRRAQIDRVVKEASARVRKEAPGVLISADVFSDWDGWARDGVAQDWPMWAKQGWINIACPMDYTQDVEALARTVAKQHTWVPQGFPLEVGIGAFTAPSAWRLADLTDTARQNGATGIMFFEYSGRAATDLIPALLAGPLREDAANPWAATARP